MARIPGDNRPTRPGSISLLTDEVREKFLTNLRTGVPIPVAAKAAGMSEGTVTQWMATGRKAAKRDPGETLSDYEEACLLLSQQAQQVFEEVHLLLAGRVIQASGKDWKAATWMLQRRHPETWNRVEQVEVSGRGGGPIEIEAVLARAQEFLDVEEVSGNGQRAIE